MAGGATLTSGEYIKHHLTNLTYGQFPDGHWGFAHSAEEAQSMGFWAFHVDSMAWSLITGLFFLWLARAPIEVAHSRAEVQEQHLDEEWGEQQPPG